MPAITLNDEQIEALKKVLGYIDEDERTHLADNNYHPGYVYTFAAKLMPLVGMTPAAMEDAPRLESNSWARSDSRLGRLLTDFGE